MLPFLLSVAEQIFKIIFVFLEFELFLKKLQNVAICFIN